MKAFILKFISSRIVQGIPVLLGITIVSFLFLHLASSDPASIRLSAGGGVPDPTALADMRHQMGLDKPLWEQYLAWAKDFVTGQWGQSFVSGQSISHSLGEALPYTLSLAILSMALTLGISIPLGLSMSRHQNSHWEKLVRGMTFLLSSIPSFVIALVLLYWLSYSWHLIPVLAMNHSTGVILPAITLALVMSSRYIRQVRTAALDEYAKPYCKSLALRGLKDSTILWKFILPAITPTLATLTALSFGSLLGGTVIVETIFNWPGLGQLLLLSITNRDYPVVQYIVVWMSISYLIVNMLAELLILKVDPRSR